MVLENVASMFDVNVDLTSVLSGSCLEVEFKCISRKEGKNKVSATPILIFHR